MKTEEYKKLLLELYKGNQGFIDKAIFTFASAAIPLLISFTDKIDLFYNQTYWLYFTSLALFVSVLFLQLIACIIAKQGCNCDLSYDNKEKEKASKLFDIADKIDYIIVFAFLLAIIMTFLTLLSDVNLKKEIYMLKNHIQQSNPK